MNETDFIKQWESDKPVYCAWGEYVVGKISQELTNKGKDLETFLKTQVKYRLKDDRSLIDKAFYRPSKNYSDPYNQIEDKVGARFIVLLLEDIKEICSIIEECSDWICDACKHFDEDKEKDPLLFTYQSVHYILRPKTIIVEDRITIPLSTPCEVQIRTLLQHAHAELTHDAVYKAKRTIQPKVHRTIAKSMALIETTDDFFSEVTYLLNHGPLQKHSILERLDGIYLSITGIESHTQKASITIWDEFEQFIDENLINNIQSMLAQYRFIAQIIKDNYHRNVFYQQSTVLFVYWMLKKKKNRLLRDWPFPKELLEPLAVDLGINTLN